MKNALLGVLQLDYTLSIGRSDVYNNCKVVLTDNKTGSYVEQYIPMDYHMDDERLSEVIKYLEDKLLDNKDLKKPESVGSEVFFSYRDRNGEAQHGKCDIKNAGLIIGDLKTKINAIRNTHESMGLTLNEE